MKTLFTKWWIYPILLVLIYLIAFPFFFRNPEHPLFFEVYSRFNGTLEHQAINSNKEQLVENFEAVIVGSRAPDFTLSTLNGEEISLSDLKGKKVFLTFWASWCPTCRRENNTLATFYEEYREQGFEILGVSLDRSRTNWETAIEKDEITWLQVSDFMGVDSPIATQYGVYSTPTTFLIDSAGVVLGKDIEAENLEALLR